MAEVKKKKQKKVKGIVKLALPAGKATPAPPVGPALGQYGVPLMDFCKEFNARTKDEGDNIIPVVLTVYEDRSFKFITKTPLTSNLILKKIGIKSGSGVPHKEKVGKITQKQLEEIAEIKMPDLNARDMDQAKKIIAGQCRSMGIDVTK